MSIEETILYCGFKIDGEEYAIAVSDIQEIIKPSQLTCVPLAPSNIHGLLNLRGQIVTTLSLRDVLGLDRNLGQAYMNIIVKGPEGL